MSFQNFGPVVCMSTEAVSYVSLTYSFTKTGLHRLDDRSRGFVLFRFLIPYLPAIDIVFNFLFHLPYQLRVGHLGRCSRKLWLSLCTLGVELGVP